MPDLKVSIDFELEGGLWTARLQNDTGLSSIFGLGGTISSAAQALMDSLLVSSIAVVKHESDSSGKEQA